MTDAEIRQWCEQVLAGHTQGDLRDVARACETLGESTWASIAWTRRLQAHPADAEALAALEALREELGEGNMPPLDPTPTAPTDADLARFALLFAGREDAHAAMWSRDGRVGYAPVPSPLTPERVADHLAGKATLGVYPIRTDGRTPWLCFDLDLSGDARAEALADRDRAAAVRRRGWQATTTLAEALRHTGLDPLTEFSGGKGFHVWVLLDSPQPAATVRVFARELLEALGEPPPEVTVEVFPKQDRVPPGGLGNLVKLPLGRHLGSGRWSTLRRDDGAVEEAPFERLRALARPPLPTTIPSGLTPWPSTPPSAPHAMPPVRPAHQDRPFTEADLDASKEVGPVLRGCAVLRAIVDRALTDRVLDHDASVVLEHSLGHLPEGIEAINYVYARVPKLARQPMRSPHRGSVVSCRRIRQRLPAVAGEVGCACPLDPPPGGYAHPLLHRDHAPAPPAPDPDLVTLLEAVGRIRDRARQVAEEQRQLEAQAAERLRGLPGQAWPVSGGTWRLADEDGVASLLFEPEAP